MPPGESSSKSEIIPRCMKSSSTPGDCMCDWCQPGGAPIFAFGGVDIPGGGGPAGTGGGMPGGGGGACLFRVALTLPSEEHATRGVVQ